MKIQFDLMQQTYQRTDQHDTRIKQEDEKLEFWISWLSGIHPDFYAHLINKGTDTPYEATRLFKMPSDLTQDYTQKEHYPVFEKLLEKTSFNLITCIRTDFRIFLISALHLTITSLSTAWLPIMLDGFIQWFQEPSSKDRNRLFDKGGGGEKESSWVVGSWYIIAMLGLMVVKEFTAVKYAENWYILIGKLKNLLNVIVKNN